MLEDEKTMLEEILTMLLKKAYPERDMSVEKIGNRFFTLVNDRIGCNDYLLDGQYSYNEVVALNNLTGYHCGFGFCKEIGPVAFIGVRNPHFCTTSGYFEFNVREYGTSFDESEYYFTVYSDEDARQVGNYTVYGYEGLEIVATKVPIAKMNYIYDSRYRCKKTMFGDNVDKKIIEMDLKLSGTYSFYEARLLATGTIEDKERFSRGELPIDFAVVGDEKYVGIINLWYRRAICLFRDVWEYGCDEPELQEIRFLTKEEAKKIDNFSLYVYAYPFSFETQKYPFEKYPFEKKDRTFDRRFKFQLPDGTDYRLV